MAAKAKSGKKRSPNELVQPTRADAVELKEEDLKRVSGGSFSWGHKGE